MKYRFSATSSTSWYVFGYLESVIRSICVAGRVTCLYVVDHVSQSGICFWCSVWQEYISHSGMLLCDKVKGLKWLNQKPFPSLWWYGTPQSINACNFPARACSIPRVLSSQRAARAFQRLFCIASSSNPQLPFPLQLQPGSIGIGWTVKSVSCPEICTLQWHWVKMINTHKQKYDFWQFHNFCINCDFVQHRLQACVIRDH